MKIHPKSPTHGSLLFEENKLDSFIQEKLPYMNEKIKFSDAEVIYKLSIEISVEALQEFFEHLEQNRDDLCVESYEFSSASLQQVNSR